MNTCMINLYNNSEINLKMPRSPNPISSQVTEESCRAQFLVPVTAQGENRAQASLERAQYLNPMVEVRAQSERAEDQPDDFFLQFDAVSLSTLLGSCLDPSKVSAPHCEQPNR